MKLGRHWKKMTRYICLNHVEKISKILNENEITQIAAFEWKTTHIQIFYIKTETIIIFQSGNILKYYIV